MSEVSELAPGRSARLSWRGALAWTAGSIYAPIAAAFFFGPVAGHSHCEGVYVQLSPILPGMLLGALSRYNDTRLWIGGVASVVIFGLVLLLFRGRSQRTVRVLAGAVGVLSLLNALAISAAIRT